MRKLVPAVGIFDIETNGLNGAYGQILCATVKDYGMDRIRSIRCDTYRDYKKQPWNDREICIDLRDILEEYDEIAGWNSEDFDIPMLRTRLLIHGERPIHSIKHRDHHPGLSEEGPLPQQPARCRLHRHGARGCQDLHLPRHGNASFPWGWNPRGQGGDGLHG